MPRSAHHHIQKVQTHKLQKSPIDYIIYGVAVAEPLGNLPQIYTIYHHRQAAGVSITSWLLYAVFATTWIVYGMHTKQKPMITGGSLFLITDLIVLTGAIMFGGKLF